MPDLGDGCHLTGMCRWHRTAKRRLGGFSLDSCVHAHAPPPGPQLPLALLQWSEQNQHPCFPFSPKGAPQILDQQAGITEPSFWTHLVRHRVTGGTWSHIG